MFLAAGLAISIVDHASEQIAWENGEERAQGI
jgi:hypothetical protein